ncbi:MAG: hypothetical protein R6X12_02470 [bacterium]
MYRHTLRSSHTARAGGGSGRARLMVLVALVAAAASGQWLETTIELPGDRLGPRHPEAIVAAGDKVYVGGVDGPGLLSLDAVTMGRIRCFTGLTGVRALAWAPASNKVYAARRDQSEIHVIDCELDSVVRVLSVGSFPIRLLHDPARNVVYCLSYNVGELAVIDVAGDSVLAVVPVPRLSYNIALESAVRKLYCVSPGDWLVTAVDADADTVLTTIATTAMPVNVVANPARNKVYVTGDGAVDIIDAVGDSLLDSIPGVTRPMLACYNPDDDKVYAVGPSYVHVIECATDSVLARLYAGVDDGAVAYNPAANAVYVAGGSEFSVIDGASDRIVVSFWLASTAGLAVDVARNRAHCAQFDVSLVSTIDGVTNQVTRVVRTKSGALALAFDPRADRFYCADEALEELFVVDGADNTVIGSAALGRQLLSVAASPVAGKVYCGTADGAVLACDGATGELIRRIELGFPAGLLEWNPAANKLYAAPRDGNLVGIVNCARDSLEAIVGLGTGAGVAALLSVPTRNEVYVASGPVGLLTVIDGFRNRVAAYIGVLGNPALLFWAPRASRVCCVHAGNVGVATLVDVERRAGVDTVPIGMYNLEYAACDTARNRLHVGRAGDGRIVVIDVEAGRHVWTLSWLGRAGALAVDTRLNRLYAPDPGANQVGTFNLETGRYIGAIPVGAGPLTMVWNSNHDRVYVGCQPGRSIAVLRDSLTVGVAEEVAGARERPLPTIVRAVLAMPTAGDPAARGQLLDVSGRSVMELAPGANDVRHLPAGAYFVRTVSADGRAAVRKVVIQR